MKIQNIIIKTKGNLRRSGRAGGFSILLLFSMASLHACETYELPILYATSDITSL